MLLQAACPALGERVLDVGCGCGATTLAAAHLVGPDGIVTGVDLSAPMLAVARQRAARAQLANTTFVQADAQTHRPDRTADVIISRFGTMFFANPAEAFTNLHRSLNAGGRLCLATWQPLEANDWLTIPGAALLRYADLPAADPGGPGMFAQSDPDAIRGVLASAGFGDVELDPVRTTLTVGATVEDAVDYLADSGPGRMILEAIDDRDRAEALAAVADTLRPRANEAGVQLRAAIWVIHARA